MKQQNDIAKLTRATAEDLFDPNNILVSQEFVRKMHHDILKTSDDKEQKMLESVNRLFSKCDKFAKIADHEFKGVQLVSKEACAQARRAQRALHIEIIRKKRLWRLKDLWRALRKNQAIQ